MNRPEMKVRMMQDEMAEAFVYDNPALFPTKQAVGRYARRMGYRRYKQNFNNKQVYFYIKDNCND